MLVLNKRVLIALLLFLIPLNVYAGNFYVRDDANILSEETKNYINEINTKLDSITKAQVAVFTIKDLGGSEIELYATKIFREYGIGDKEKNNGVLFLLAAKERKFRIEVGYGLEGALNDAKTGRIQDTYMIPYFKENNWDIGMKNGFDAVIQEIKKEYNIDFDSDTPISNTTSDEDTADIFGIIITLYFIYHLSLAIGISLQKDKKKLIKSVLYIIFASGIFFVIYSYEILIIIAAVVNTVGLLVGILGMNNRRRHNSGFGGGLFGGGSSGGFGGDSFGGFSGGSSGGGGSSRSF